MKPDLQAKDSKLRKISKNEINDLPILAWEGPIQIIETIEAMEDTIQLLKNQTLLGFDTETRPTFKKGQYYPPALIQIATPDCVYLFRICICGSFAPLLSILESPDIIKSGVGIHDDVRELRKVLDFEAQGFFEISEFTTQIGYENRGLRALAALLLNGRISKAAQVSNWAREKLDSKQIKYAATDAWISRQIYIEAKKEAAAVVKD